MIIVIVYRTLWPQHRLGVCLALVCLPQPNLKNFVYGTNLWLWRKSWGRVYLTTYRTRWSTSSSPPKQEAEILNKRIIKRPVPPNQPSISFWVSSRRAFWQTHNNRRDECATNNRVTTREKTDSQQAKNISVSTAYGRQTEYSTNRTTVCVGTDGSLLPH